MTTGFNNRQVTFDGEYVIIDGKRVLKMIDEKDEKVIDEVIRHLEADYLADEEREEIREDAYETGFDNGYEEGYGQGYDQGWFSSG